MKKYRQKHLTAICAACQYDQGEFTAGEVSEFHCAWCYTKNVVTDVSATTVVIKAEDEDDEPGAD